MMNWKYFVIATVMGSTLFAQFKLDQQIEGRVVFKTSDGKEMELKDDSKWTIEVLDTSIDKMVLKNQYQVKLKSDSNEVVYDMIQARNETAKRIDLRGDKEINKQALYLNCQISQKPKDADKVEYKTSTLEYVKTSGCTSYVLESKNKFKMASTSLCIGKKEAKVSAPVAIEETIFCMAFDSPSEDDVKNIARFSFKRTLENLKEQQVRSEASGK